MVAVVFPANMAFAKVSHPTGAVGLPRGQVHCQLLQDPGVGQLWGLQGQKTLERGLLPGRPLIIQPGTFKQEAT